MAHAETSAQSAPQIVTSLVERFVRNRDAYRGDAYNETQVRREFIDPLFKALGWDIDNEQGLAEAYKDVIHEDAIKIGGVTKAPDYCFRIGGTRKFFVEAKKPSVGIRDDSEPAYQLRRYAWSAKLPLSILTDFEELAVYDCRIKPGKDDRSSKARILYLTCEEYADRWGELAGVFSREAVLKGSFDKFAESTRGKRGTAAVDEAFLEEIESWRDALARNFALRNPQLSVRDLNFAVERTIDRLIFLRMCEDRGIESYAQLRDLLNGHAVYARLAHLFRAADDRYNAGLFYFRQEPDRGPPDELTLGLSLDDKVLKDILSRLYYPDCPYEFSVLSADILGQVYEQFLGKVIRLTPGHRAVVEEKPEVRKAGGVYYTPTYIVDYIVRNTIGRLLEGRTPADVGPERETKTGKAKKLARGARMLRVLDPACGSGSFLLGAFQYLLDWHRDWYVGDGPERHRQRIYQGAAGQWRLSIREKKRILLNNIYGVDIDPQAVEVTKLSLLLKVLEGETAETVGSTLRLFHERALPDLSDNIKCGNSLIGPEFFAGKEPDMFDEEERYRINAFDWRREFAEAVQAGGFDAVIGNPPYLFLTEVDEEHRRFYEKRYQSVTYRFDLYGAFIERAVVEFLRLDAVLGFIIPHTLLSNNSFQRLRRLLSARTHIYRIIDIGPGVFAGARNETMLLFLKNRKADADDRVDLISTTATSWPEPVSRFSALQRQWTGSEGDVWLVQVNGPQASLLARMRGCDARLGDFCTANQGLRTGNNAKYLSDRPRGVKWKRAVGGKHIARYAPITEWTYVYYDSSVLDAPRRPDIFFGASKIVIQEIRNIALPRRLVATLDTDEFIGLQSTNVINLKPAAEVDIRYVLGLLNSAAVNTYFRLTYPGNNHIPSNQLLQIPIPVPPNRGIHDRLVTLVGRLLELGKLLSTTKPTHARVALERQIHSIDEEVDKLVFSLYGLTEMEMELALGNRK